MVQRCTLSLFPCLPFKTKSRQIYSLLFCSPKNISLYLGTLDRYIDDSKLHTLLFSLPSFWNKNRQIHWLSFLPGSAYQKLFLHIQAPCIFTYMIQSCIHSFLLCLASKTKTSKSIDFYSCQNLLAGNYSFIYWVPG